VIPVDLSPEMWILIALVGVWNSVFVLKVLKSNNKWMENRDKQAQVREEERDKQAQHREDRMFVIVEKQGETLNKVTQTLERLSVDVRDIKQKIN